jgi:PAS domain S-box-containing protein
MNKPLRVLVIEDSEFDAAMLVNLLRQGGYTVTWQRVQTAAGMRAALASASWDIVLSDHQMPEFSAPEALALLQASGQDLPFIIVSGGIGEATAIAAMKAGAHDYLIKGQLGRLVPAVERELREAANRAARRQAERSLQESELRYRLLFENSPDAVALVDAQGQIRFVNPAVEAVFGYSAAEIVGHSFADLLAPQAALGRLGEALAHVEPGLARAGGPRLETVGRRKDAQEIPVEIGFGQMEMEGKKWAIAFIRDLTERKKAEKTLRETALEFQFAREIQERLFPKSPPALPGFDIAGASCPAAATGGDYFDYLPMLDEGLGIVIGDVTGHGLGPALLMAETRAYLRIVALNRHSAGEVLTRANRVLAEDLGGERFVTVLLARLDPSARRLVYANAGHPPGHVLGPQGEIKFTLKRTGMPLGLQSDTVYADSQPVVLQPGDLVVFLTDGIEEAMAPDDRTFGVEKALDVVRANRHRPARDIVQALYAAVRDFSQGAPQSDDVTAVILKVLAEPA